MKNKLMGLKLKEEVLTIENGDDPIILTIKEMNAGEASKYENSLYTIVGKTVKYNTEEAKTKLVALTTYDAEGNRCFEISDIEQVKTLPAHVVDEIFQLASKLNGLEKGKN